MKVLVLFAFVVLGCSLAAARNVTKCELRQQLMVAFSSLPKSVTVNGLTEDAFLAKVVCHAEQLSGFNTSAVTDLSRGTGKESQEDSTKSGSSESKEKDKKKSKGKGKSSESNEDDVGVTLYGLFQLPDDLVCSSTNSASLNLCDISCNKLTDDDISDDINCVVKVINELVTKNFMAKNSKELWEVVKKLVGGNCNNLDQYFSGC
ncbi:lysozyme C, milk isozyme-like [Poecilia latipinna]|uniref:lysozyme C, milk isozyme-like n=1 Tax=Poecilia formosa TaxID=48698 RepID=UPI000443D640|nr:PREDICTED: lysozyme C, milk isozyme-like [Poecilia formosa]XP_014862114.1 PREDICTED: lysozyme C, milk isozyme-like [Poecilia mexicana]XP_014890056.1 PREDICTED: lysozyme C, milk isozyme-like [Poecilia latipinna]